VSPPLPRRPVGAYLDTYAAHERVSGEGDQETQTGLSLDLRVGAQQRLAQDLPQRACGNTNVARPMYSPVVVAVFGST